MINDQNEYFFFNLKFEKGIHYFIKIYILFII